MRTIEERILNVKDIDYIDREDGKIYSTHNRGRAKYHQEIKQRMNSDGYMCITVGKTGNRTVASVHRLVAKTFIPNPDNKPYVNHINGIKNDNRVVNLEWCTASENVQHAYDTNLIPKKIKKTTYEEKINSINLFENGLSKEQISKQLFIPTTRLYTILVEHFGKDKYKEISKKIESWNRFTKSENTGIRKMEEGTRKFRLSRKDKYLGWFTTLEEAIEFKKEYISKHDWRNG